MKLIKKKFIKISSKGEISFSFSIKEIFNKNKFYIKDNKNCLLLNRINYINSIKKFIYYKKNIF